MAKKNAPDATNALTILESLPIAVLVANLYNAKIASAKVLQDMAHLNSEIPAGASTAEKERVYKEFAEQLYSATEDVSNVNEDVF